MRRVLFKLVTAIFTFSALLLSVVAVPASAQIFQPSIVSPTPAAYTPYVVRGSATSNGAINSFAQVGSTMYAGGDVGAVAADGTTNAQARHNFFSFNATNGAIYSYAPVFNGVVWQIVPYGGSLYVGGEFTAVNGQNTPYVVKINLANQTIDTSFHPAINNAVTDLQVINGHLIVAGKFTQAGGRAVTGLASLNPTTGANDGLINLNIQGTSNSNAGPTKIYRFAVNPTGNRLVMIGNFTSVSGQNRTQAALITLDGPTAALTGWDSPRLHVPCESAEPAFMRDVDWSPDGSYFVMVSTGYISPTGMDNGLCDSASRWEGGVYTSTNPTWINWTGGDTLHSVAVTGTTVYVAGHERWLNNPFGQDSAGYGAVSRPGIGSIDPNTGQATAWNPTRSRGVGAKELYATSQGLWVGSDGPYFNNKYHPDIAFCPLP